MDGSHYLKTRVTAEMKERVHALAEQQLVTESVWLKRLIATALRDAPIDESGEHHDHRPSGKKVRDVLQTDDDDKPSLRVYIRLRPTDRLLLRERAAARGMRSATYTSVLVRAHLWNLAPLPKDELVALKRSVAELGAIGRSLNQIARAVNRGDRVVGPTREDCRAILKICESLRDNVKALIRTNVSTWDIPP